MLRITNVSAHVVDQSRSSFGVINQGRTGIECLGVIIGLLATCRNGIWWNDSQPATTVP